LLKARALWLQTFSISNIGIMFKDRVNLIYAMQANLKVIP